MTYEKLLAKIGEPADEGYEYCDIIFNKALRAVVELHKPVERENYLDLLMCDACENSSYPCPTIQSIEKELN
jgi:hypothetical protein